MLLLLAALLCSTCKTSSSPGREETISRLEQPSHPELVPVSGELGLLAGEMKIAATRVRELPFREPVEVFEGSPEVVAWLVEREMAELRAGGHIEAEQATLEAFGFIPGGGDFEDLILDLYQEQIRGLYDHREKLLLVVPMEDTLSKTGKSTGQAAALAKTSARLESSLFLLHELVHALQDQHFGLGRFVEPGLTIDASLAGQALVEGDATYAMYEHFLQGLGRSLSDLPDLDFIIEMVNQTISGPENEALARAPLYVRETLMFSYLAGLVFVHQLHRLGGWEAVNRAYENPPATTQQVLRVERYLEGASAEAISLPPLPSLEEAGFTQTAAGALGELGLRIFIAEHTDGEPGPGISGGWRGDSYSVYSREGDEAPVAVWAIAFDTSSTALSMVAAAQDFGSSTPVLAREVSPGLVGMVTNLNEEEADLVLEALSEATRSSSGDSPVSSQPSELEENARVESLFQH